MDMYISRERSRQPATSRGLGAHFTSPVKKRPGKRKTQVMTTTAFDATRKKQRLQDELDALLATEVPVVRKRKSGPMDDGVPHERGMEEECEEVEIREEPVELLGQGSLDAGQEPEGGLPESYPQDNTESNSNNLENQARKKKRVTPDQATTILYEKWRALLPLLVDDILAYTSSSIGIAIQTVGSEIKGLCRTPSRPGLADLKVTKVICLYFDHFKSINVLTCSCCPQALAQVLVRNGLFPTAPSQIRMAISIELLDFYAALFERSCDAVNAMAAALNTFYTKRGFHFLNNKNEKIREPFRRGLGYAAQWLDGLRVLIERRVEDALTASDQILQQDAASTLQKNDLENLSECMRILRQLCPACFGGSTFGRPLEDGGDFQICTDGNFHHRHLISGGSSIPFHDPKHIIPKAFVDETGEKIIKARKLLPKRRKCPVPDEAIDDCEESYDAANGDKKKAAGEARYDDYGWMSLVCRHDIPLFFANIDTPGEQQKYAIALILWFAKHVPKNATFSVLYDIACVVDRSVNKFDILPADLLNRVQFVTTAMHVYGHQWACQLAYNPRLCRGLGLTDGEGVERIWSRLRKMVGIVRTSSVARRIWLTDRQLSSIAHDLRDDLGDWIRRRLKQGIQKQGEKAKEFLKTITVSNAELQTQWEMQKGAQMSLRSHAPARLKKELDTVLTLQGDLDAVEKAIQTAKVALSASSAPSQSASILVGLEEMHDQLSEKVEELYVSLNIHESYPDLQGVGIDFVRTLLMARDLKVNIRKRAIGSFFEWDRLDQAVGGRSNPLGTKLHQHTRKAIAKRQPALMRSIRKFNLYCEKLENLYEPTSNIPLPLPLPTKLMELRDNSSLMEDVWITPSNENLPMWLEDSEVREGIRAMLKAERCVEEQRRLGMESDNLCRWFGREIGAVELALRNPLYSSLNVVLSQYRDHLHHQKPRWVTPMASALRFDNHITNSKVQAARFLPESETLSLRWVHELRSSSQEIRHPEEGSMTPSEVNDADSDVEESFEGFLPSTEPDDVLITESMESLDDGEEGMDTDSSALAYASEDLSLVWTPPGMNEDVSFIDYFNSLVIAPFVGAKYAKRKYGSDWFSDPDLRRFDSPTSLLNDTCINGGAAVIQQLFSEIPFIQILPGDAPFSPHIFCRKSVTRPLTKNSGEICGRHWVLAVAYVRSGEVYLFDSFAGRNEWKKDIPDISLLIRRLILIAKNQGHTLDIPKSGWVAKRAVVQSVQSNGHDCGLWVLAWIAIVFRGFNSSGTLLTEDIMPEWRALLVRLIRNLPQLVRIYANADFIRIVARYYKQASEYGQEDFLLLDGYKIFKDRWPASQYSPSDFFGKVKKATRVVNPISLAMGRYWFDELNLQQDRRDRDYASRWGLGFLTFPEDADITNASQGSKGESDGGDDGDDSDAENSGELDGEDDMTADPEWFQRVQSLVDDDEANILPPKHLRLRRRKVTLRPWALAM
ncbi:hypothetical protein M413DRAFT_30325 [Hebeloma cylindrosporum]|uniref:Ubiquitin-like protease family profile domain-containing protein n=1 Tax=Hebeloma cylindrosporum TaxID=76867 RepID=A0A0C3C3P3_HEBCY|nr:hypothetical protein M413DRAFT_30325 [Hebeloma cylindrosporum h7]